MLSRNQIFLSMVFILVAGFLFMSTPGSSYAIENGSNCCIVRGTTGCDNLTCEEFICGFDPPCCSDSWDTQCVEEAEEFCEVCGGTPPPPPTIPTLSEWGLIAMAGILGIVGFMVLRRRKVAA